MDQDYTEFEPGAFIGIDGSPEELYVDDGAKYNTTTPEEYLYRFEDVTKQMLDITRRKNKDYSGEQLAFRNFEMVEQLGICTTEEGILVRMVDKITRASNLIHQEAAVTDEKLEDTLLDLANYSIILKIYRETRQK